MKRFSHRDFKKFVPNRRKSDNKTRGGKTLIIAGSQNMEGAALLCARAAAKAGSGYVYLLSPAKVFKHFDDPDFLTYERAQNFLKFGFSSVAIGPGLRDEKLIRKWLNYLSQKKFENVVLDAEALNYLSRLKKIPTFPKTWILTPHEGELSKLLKIPAEKIRSKRLFYADLAQKKYGCIVLLKGHQTLVVDAKTTVMITSGNASLAKAGTGDVLTGIIAAFLSQKVTPFQAACLGSYLHGALADNWLKSKNDILSLRATDLLDRLPKALRSLR